MSRASGPRPCKHLLHIHPQPPRLKSLLLPTRIPILPLRGQIVPHSFTCLDAKVLCTVADGGTVADKFSGGEKRFGSVGVCVLGSGEACLWGGCLCLAVRKFGSLRSGDMVQCDMERWRGVGESLMTGVTGDAEMIAGMIC